MVVPIEVEANQILSGQLLAKNLCAKVGFIASACLLLQGAINEPVGQSLVKLTRRYLVPPDCRRRYLAFRAASAASVALSSQC